MIGPAPVGLAVRTHADDGTIVLELAGELDLATADLVREALVRAVDEQPDRLVIDLSGLSFIDSTGIKLMVFAHQQLPHALEIRPGRRAVQRVFELTRLIDALPFSGASG